MYAELLEMREDNLWSESFDINGTPQQDGLPNDLEASWVGLAPVPVGKRCLAVTTHSAGLAGIGERLVHYGNRSSNIAYQFQILSYVPDS